MPVYQYSSPPAAASTLPFARLGRAFAQPRISLWLVGPSATREVATVIDPGAECCLFPEWLAWRVGIRRSGASPQVTMGSSVTLTGVAAWFETVELELRDSAAIHRPFRWTAAVGFTGKGGFGKTSAFGILGVNGGLDQVQRVEFKWAGLGGPEVVVRT